MKKFLRLKGFGNKETHLIPLKNIVDIHFTNDFTSITLIGGYKVNVNENESDIMEMLSYFQFDSISVDDLCEAYNPPF